MSLINDALKRAKEAQKQEPPAGPSPMPPVEHRPDDKRSRFLLPAIIVVLIAAAAFCAGLAFSTRSRTETPLVSKAPMPAAPAPVVTETTNPPAPVRLSAAETVVVLPASNAPVADAPSASAATPIQSSSPEASRISAPALPKIQGIAYDPVQPSAIINGKTAFVGEEVDGMRVLGISRTAVTLVVNGWTNTLGIAQ